MAYERAMMEALICEDSRRIEAIQRLNTPRVYRDNAYDWNDEINDKLIALSGRASKEIYANSLTRRCC